MFDMQLTLEDHNHKIIFGASGGGNIMYADESTDLTEYFPGRSTNQQSNTGVQHF